MSYAIDSGMTGLAAVLADNAGRAYDSVAKLTEQSSDGLIADTYAGLGANAYASLSLRPMLNHLATWQSNIDSATAGMGVAQTALSQIDSAASAFTEKLSTLTNLEPTAVDSVAAEARAALQQVAGLLNTQNGGTYVFAGQDRETAPVPDAGDILGSTFYSAVGSAVSSLSTTSGDDVVAGALAAVEADPPYSSSLADARPATVQTGEGQSTTVGIVAGTNAFVRSDGTSSSPPTSSGSYTSDILAVLAAIGNLSGDEASDANFSGLVQGLQTTLSGALSALSEDQGILGDRQTALSTTKTTLATLADSVKTEVSNAEDVDMTTVASELSSAQTRLQASYELISKVGTLTLTSYLS